MTMRFTRNIPTPPIPPRTKKLTITVGHLMDARIALQRGEQAHNEAQALDAINSAQLFLKLARAVLDGTGEGALVVKTDKFNRSTVNYDESKT